MTDDDLMARYKTIRMQIFEVYEEGADLPLVVASDRTLLMDLQPTDRVVCNWWVREGSAVLR